MMEVGIMFKDKEKGEFRHNNYLKTIKGYLLIDTFNKT